MVLSTSCFCKNVRKLREERNLSVREMAGILDLSEENLLLLESGILTDEMDVGIIYNIHLHFGITPNEMFEER